ncbi:ketosteroid isomerase-like protein [Bradyrhizobium sp. CIR48]|uniref:nuclear transport factor 2 family protein n=1 Tax=Bradyrhizobium sp. CIR48 TaxID=2663840 RepID=UPI0016059BB1|nr:nuclear transport factor 2 family protein [Bradyrhizobium sp. CIR48]MBB4423828.1 ketosteroid isomerase-like protein [Bradyrhizobium sp. CIR48]
MADRDNPNLHALLRSFSAAIAAGDGEALADCFTPDGIYDDYFFGPREGRTGIIEMIYHFYQGGRDFSLDLLGHFIDA